MSSKPERWTIHMHAAVGPQLRNILRQRIIQADLAPGVALSETEIAKIYGVSRQPVREAFIKLGEEGLVEIRPQRGTFVSRISVAGVMDARFVREAVEADIAKLLAAKPDSTVVRELTQLVEQQRNVASDDPLQFLQLDEAFHRQLSVAADKHGAWRVVEDAKAQMDRVRVLSAQQFPVERLIEQHQSIVDAIATGDVVAAEAAVRHHLREVLLDLPRIARSFPDYFKDLEVS